MVNEDADVIRVDENTWLSPLNLDEKLYVIIVDSWRVGVGLTMYGTE
jgi:hypothetical protein